MRVGRAGPVHLRSRGGRHVVGAPVPSTANKRMVWTLACIAQPRGVPA